MRAFLLPLFVLLAQYTITMLAAPVTTTLENFPQILSDLVIPQEQRNGTAAAKVAPRKQSNPLIPSKVTNAIKTMFSAREPNLNQHQITRNLPLGKRFRASNGPTINAAAIRSQPSFHVPNTNIVLIFRLSMPMRQDVMRRAIISARGFVQGILNHDGDGPLPQANDPWKYGTSDNDFLLVLRSHDERYADKRLTWRIVEITLLGLWDFLYLNGIYQESGFNIYDSTLGHGGFVGKGALVAKQGSEIRNFTQELSGDQNLWSTTGGPISAVGLSR